MISRAQEEEAAELFLETTGAIAKKINSTDISGKSSDGGALDDILSFVKETCDKIVKYISGKVDSEGESAAEKEVTVPAKPSSSSPLKKLKGKRVKTTPAPEEEAEE